MPEDFQGSLLDALVHTDDVIYEMLPADEIIRRILAVYAIPPEMLGEMSNTNYHANESQERLYRRQFFGEQEA